MMPHKNPEKLKAYKKQYAKKYYIKNKDAIKAKVKAYVKRLGQAYIDKKTIEVIERNTNNPEKYIYIRLKTRAKQQNTPFNLTLEDIKIPDKCPILKKEILTDFKVKGKKGPTDNSPSVDRIDNTKGYVKGNIQIICNLANSMKRNATPEELLQFAYWVILTYGHLIQENM